MGVEGGIAMRILLAVDGSRPAERASELVAAMPWREGGRVRIVSVAPSRSDVLGVPWMALTPPDADRLEDEALRIHRDALDAAEREICCARDDLVIEPVLLRGRAASMIVAEARDMPADLVVVGHRGHGPWESMLLGSVSAEVVDHAPCPVLVARDERLGPVVFADDGSISARTAEAVLRQWPLFTGVDVHVVTVAEEGFPYASAVAPLMYSDTMYGYAEASAERIRLARDECDATAKRLREAGFAATAEIREGDAAHQIVLYAREHEAGVIVVGTRGMTGLRRLILGSVARNVLLHADCSVLVVRESTTHVSLPEDHDAVDQPADRQPVAVGPGVAGQGAERERVSAPR
jgi:nucleotide-binding universal stress UspA family protein